MEWGGPVAGGRSNDAQLDHVLKFLTSDAKTIRCEATRTKMYWLTSRGCNAMGNIMVELNFHVSRIGYGGKFGEYCFESIRRLTYLPERTERSCASRYSSDGELCLFVEKASVVNVNDERKMAQKVCTQYGIFNIINNELPLEGAL